MKKITVLTIDDHTLIRETWKPLLETHTTFQVVATCYTAEEGINLAKSLSPTVVLLDITLPGMNGLETIKPQH